MTVRLLQFLFLALLLVVGGVLFLTPKDMLSQPVIATVDGPAFPETTPDGAISMRDLATSIAAGTSEDTPKVELAVANDDGPEGDRRWITASALNMRAAPNVNAQFLTSLPFGTEVGVLDTSGTWSMVTAPDGTKGWLSSKFLTADQPVSQ